MKSAIVCSFCLSIAAQASHGFSAEPTLPTANLVVNGDFAQGGKGWPADLLKRKGIALRREGERTWLAISGYGGVTQSIRLDEDWTSLRVSMRMRVGDVVRGQEGWHDARLAMTFVDSAGKRVGPWPNVFHAEGTHDWATYQRVFQIPAGAVKLELSPSMFGASGTVEFTAIEATVARLRSGAAVDTPRPAEADDLEDLAKAWRQVSATRTRVCLDGLWQFLPASRDPGYRVPAGGPPPPPNRGWGWFKVPALWPTSAGGAQQPLLDGFDDQELSHLEQAWFQRPLKLPVGLAGRRILLDFTMIQTHVRVWIDGHEAGERFFPGGRIDITRHVKPGQRQTLSLLVTARPLEKESSAFSAPERVATSKAVLKCKGLTGDVFLLSEPAQETLGEVHVITSTRQGTIALETQVDPPGSGPCEIEANIYDGDKLVKAIPGTVDAATGRVRLAGAWKDARRWDLHTPRNIYTAVVTLSKPGGRIVDQSLPVRFGFREFWIDGRDFYLNGSPVHLRALHTTNTSAEADLASIEGCRVTCRRLKEHGFNALITSNYSFAPGDVGYMDGLFNAADEEGVLTTFSLPHIKDFNTKLDTPQQSARYRELCQWLIHRAQNHPSIVLYAMNHNATGYKGDENPLWMDGVYAPESEWSRTNPARLKTRKQAALAAAIATELDSTRPVYHHQSGNLGQLYTVNIYLDWAPLQERSDWLEPWATRGVKPMFFVEWGLPHVSSWSSFRGPEFIWRCKARQQVWDSEYAAAYVGQEAYRMTPTKLKSLDWEESLWARGEPFSWSELIRYFRQQDENYTHIQAMFAADNWRSHRTWGVSAMLPWDQENLWRMPGGVGQRVKAARPYDDLLRPGIVPDAVAAVGAQAIYSRDMSRVKLSELGRTFLRWNMPLCAYVGGDGRHFTEKGHDFLPGETVRKQLVILNDTREPAHCKYAWSLAPTGAGGAGEAVVAPGGKTFVAVAIPLAEHLAAGRYTLTASFDFGAGGRQEDRLALDVMTPPSPVNPQSRIALFDPPGQTTRMLRKMGLEFRSVTARDALDNVDLLIVGRQALTTEGAVPGLSRVPQGMRMLVFEQDADVLQKQFGFRVNIHGLRQAFVRVPSHAALAGLSDESMRDSRGAATTVPPYLDITSLDQNDPKWNWSGFQNTRVWRCGNHGSVATVLIEKPDRGDFLPLVDGGFDLQYAPLLQWTLGRGLVIFCQMDVTGRSDVDPAAHRLTANLIRFLDRAKFTAPRHTQWVGDRRTEELLGQLGIDAQPMQTSMAEDKLLVWGPGRTAGGDLRQRIEGGLNVLALGLGEAEIARVLPGVLSLKTEPIVPRMQRQFDAPVLSGLSNAELHWRTRLTLAAIQDGPEDFNQVLRVLKLGRGQIVFCQAAPWMFDCEKKGYLRTTYRRNLLLVARLLHNLGAKDATGIATVRYVQAPQATDDPYRYYRW